MPIKDRFKRALGRTKDTAGPQGTTLSSHVSQLSLRPSTPTATVTPTRASPSPAPPTYGSPSQTFPAQSNVDVWERAYKDLCQKDKDFHHAIQLIVFNTPQQLSIGQEVSPRDLPNKLRQNISARLEEIERSRLRFNVGEHEIKPMEAIERMVSRTIRFQGVVNAAASLNPYASIAWAGVSTILMWLVQASQQDVAAIAALDSISDIMVRYEAIVRIYLYPDRNPQSLLHQRLLQQQDLRNLQSALESKIVKLFSLLLEIQIRLTCHYSKSQGRRVLNDLVLADDWQTLLHDLQKIDREIGDSLLVFGHDFAGALSDQNNRMKDTLSDQMVSLRADYLSAEDKRVLGTLFRVPSADAVTSHAQEYEAKCLPNTRIEILAQIMDWSKSPHTQSIFWLCGMAGTGKSTIARTVAHDLQQTSRLAANFFFSRGEAVRNNAAHFVSTVSAQLTYNLPSTSGSIAKVLKDHPDICSRKLQEQWERLIRQPLSQLSGNHQPTQPLVLVVDALDECTKNEDVKQLISLFFLSN